MAPNALSKNQIDQLGMRLERGNPDEADVRSLDEYRRSFGEGKRDTITYLEDISKVFDSIKTDE